MVHPLVFLLPLPPLLLPAALHGAVLAQTPDTLPPDSARDAYLDETARRLVLGAKAARDTSRHTIDAYTAVIRERVGVEAPSFRRDRLHGYGHGRQRHAEPTPVRFGVVLPLG